MSSLPENLNVRMKPSRRQRTQNQIAGRKRLAQWLWGVFATVGGISNLLLAFMVKDWPFVIVRHYTGQPMGMVLGVALSAAALFSGITILWRLARRGRTGT
jgi:hypothetical protein